MNKTSIEWCDYTINPIKGLCKEGCPYCYAAKMYKRFKWNPEIRFDESVFNGLDKLKPGSKVFVCSTHDMFGGWIDMQWIIKILNVCRNNPALTFILLTKSPQWLHHYQFPDNVWLGVSVEGREQSWRIKTLLQPEIKANVKFVSFEPLQEDFYIQLWNNETQEYLKWIIIGQETGNRKQKVKVERSWVDKIIYNNPGISIFIKDNLKHFGIERKEFPLASTKVIGYLWLKPRKGHDANTTSL